MSGNVETGGGLNLATEITVAFVSSATTYVVARMQRRQAELEYRKALSNRCYIDGGLGVIIKWIDYVTDGIKEEDIEMLRQSKYSAEIEDQAILMTNRYGRSMDKRVENIAQEIEKICRARKWPADKSVLKELGLIRKELLWFIEKQRESPTAGKPRVLFWRFVAWIKYRKAQ